jgi:hypothetical protein
LGLDVFLALLVLQKRFLRRFLEENTCGAEGVRRHLEDGLRLTIPNRFKKLILEDFDFYAGVLLWRFSEGDTDWVLVVGFV